MANTLSLCGCRDWVSNNGDWVSPKQARVAETHRFKQGETVSRTRLISMDPAPPLFHLWMLSWHYLDYIFKKQLLHHKPGPDRLRAVACAASCWLVALSDTVYTLTSGRPNATHRDSGMIMSVLHVSNRTGFRWIMACWTSPAWTWRTSACTSAWRRTGTAGCSPTLSYASSVGFFPVKNQARYADDTPPPPLPASIYLRVDWKSPFHHLLHPRSHWQNIHYSFVCNFLLYKETLSLPALFRNHAFFFWIL